MDLLLIVLYLYHGKLFVEYEQALVLKELGFDEPCFRWYDERWGDDLHQDKYNTNKDLFMTDLDCSAPLYQQAFRWFREKYDLHCWPEPTGSNRYCCKYDGNDETGYRWVGYLRNDNKEILFYLTYEEAELHCLKKLIEIVKNK